MDPSDLSILIVAALLSGVGLVAMAFLLIDGYLHRNDPPKPLSGCQCGLCNTGFIPPE